MSGGDAHIPAVLGTPTGIVDGGQAHHAIRAATAAATAGPAHASAEQQHAAAMKAAFLRCQAASFSQWDLWAGTSLSVLLLLTVPSTLQREHQRGQAASLLLEVGLRAGPAWLASHAWQWYWPRRSIIIAATRFASAALPRLAVQPILPATGEARGARCATCTAEHSKRSARKRHIRGLVGVELRPVRCVQAPGPAGRSSCSSPVPSVSVLLADSARDCTADWCLRQTRTAPYQFTTGCAGTLPWLSRLPFRASSQGEARSVDWCTLLCREDPAVQIDVPQLNPAPAFIVRSGLEWCT